MDTQFKSIAEMGKQVKIISRKTIKMDALFMGIFNVIPRCVLRIFSREYKRTQYRTASEKELAKALYTELSDDSAIAVKYVCVGIFFS
jgi:asparagine synthetase B (glutamine-hydrolysing)